MAIKVITEPTTEPVSLRECKDHLRIVHDDEDTLLQMYLKAAREFAEDTLAWRAFITQKLMYTIDRFPLSPKKPIELPRPPLQSIESVQYMDKDGALQTLSEDNYWVDTNGFFGAIYLKSGETWPSNLFPYNAVKIVYKAGYGDAPENIENLEILKIGILMLAAGFDNNREPLIIGASSQEITFGNVDLVSQLFRRIKAYGADNLNEECYVRRDKR